MKNKRHETILKIIHDTDIETQEVLQSKLLDLGMEVTQATISRDIRELGLIKAVSKNGINCYMQPDRKMASDKSLQNKSLFSTAVTSIDYAINTVVIKCHAGHAGGACAALDSMKLPMIIGTIAGDDTIFILTRSEKMANELVNILEDMM